MKRADLADLLLLAALWGGSFLFMRLGAPDFGPVALSALRVALAALALMPLMLLRGHWGAVRTHWRPMVIVGIVNSALPFTAYAYAALSITAGLSAVFNATAPLWGALIAALWLKDRLTPQRAAGLALGFGGVLWLAWDKASFKPGADTAASWAVIACLAATVLYGFAANYTKRTLQGVPPLAVAAMSQAGAALFLALPAWWWWPATMPGAKAWAAVVLLGVLSTGVAYLLYFRLIARVGPAKAISVTFLVPLFAVLWGWLFLGEAVTPVMVAACCVILAGTALATGLVQARSREPSG